MQIRSWKLYPLCRQAPRSSRPLQKAILLAIPKKTPLDVSCFAALSMTCPEAFFSACCQGLQQHAQGREDEFAQAVVPGAVVPLV